METRREFLRRPPLRALGVAVAASELMSLSCKESPQQSWNNLPAIERLNRLLQKNYPSFSDFNRQAETTLATAQEYSKQTGYTSPDRLASAVHYVNEDEFISEFDKDGKDRGQISLTKDQIDEYKKSTSAFTTLGGEIYINQDLIEEQINNPDIIQQTGNKDIRTLLEICLQIHEINHKNTKLENISFEEFSLRLPGDPVSIKYTKMNGFKIGGIGPQGNLTYLSGGNEAITDLAAFNIVNKKMGFRYLTSPKYAGGSNLIKMHNNIANVSDEEFLKHVRGDLPQSQLLEKWGSHKIETPNTRSNLRKGISTLIEIALATQGFVNFLDVEKNINNNFIKGKG